MGVLDVHRVGQRGQDRLVISWGHNRSDLSMVRQGSSGCSSDISNGKSNASTSDFSSGEQSDILSLLSLKDSGLVESRLERSQATV